MPIKIYLVTLFFFCYLPNTLFSQPFYLIKGKVVNADTGDPVPNANIAVKGTLSGTGSGADGFFEMPLGSGNHILRVTSIGYSPVEIAVTITGALTELLIIRIQPEKLQIEGVDVFGRFVLAARDSSINRVPLSILPAITTISAVDIEKQGAVTLMDAIKFVPGGWTETRGRKTKQFFSIRGQKYPYPDYSINGIWQKEFEETSYYFSALDIESVEIIRSASALVKGLSGLTGVIDVKTKKPESETISLLARYGELNSFNTNFQYGNKLEDFTFNTSISFFGTDGPFGRNGKERIGNMHGEIDWDLNAKMKLSAGISYIYGLRQLLLIDEAIGANNIKSRREKYDPVRTLLAYSKLNYRGNDGSLTEWQVNMSQRNVDFENYNIPQETASYHEEDDYEYGMNVLHSRPISKNNTLRVGALYNHWVAPEGKRFYVGRSCNVHTFSGVIASEQRVDKFLFDAGIRMIGGHIVEWGGFGIEGSAAGFQNVASVENQAAPLEWQSVFGATYLLSSASSLHYNFSGGTIAPRKGSVDNSGESPENEGRFQHDLGLKYRSAGNHEFSISSFFTQRKGAIDFNGETVVTEDNLVMELYENRDKRSYGVEFTTKVELPALHSSIFTNAMLMKGEKEEDGKMADDNQLPKVILNGGILFDNSRFDVNLFGNYIGPYTNNRFVNPAWVQQNGDFPLGNFVSVDMTAGYTFTGRFSARFFIEAKNILDEKYMTVAGYPDSGRIFMAGVRILSFSR